MKTIDLKLDTGEAQIDQLRPILEQAIGRHFTEGFLRHRWKGDVLVLSGPGAQGSLAHAAGRLRLQAELRPPASWMHRLIRKKIEASLVDVAAAIAPS